MPLDVEGKGTIGEASVVTGKHLRYASDLRHVHYFGSIRRICRRFSFNLVNTASSTKQTNVRVLNL